MATDFGPFGTLAEDDPFMLALQMQQMQGGGTQRIPFPPDPETGLSPLSGQMITPPIYTGPMTEEFSGRSIPFESVPQNPVTRVDFESNLPKTNNLNRSNQTQNMPETQAPDPLANYRSVMNREPGFFQENAPLILGLLGGFSGLLEAMGPSRTPVSSGQVFARGLQSGLGGYMGGLKYQQGMESSRQQEARNILDALGKEQNIQAALDKRKANNQLRSAIPQMIQDLSSAEGLTARDKILIAQAERLREASPTTSLNILNQIASKSDQFQFFNLGDGKIAKVNKVEGTTEIISGEGAGSVTNIGTQPYENAPVKSETERAFFYLNNAPIDSPNYKLAYDIYSQPKLSVSGATLTPNMEALGFARPTLGQQSGSLIDEDQTSQTQAAPGTQVQTSDLGTAKVTKVVNLKPIPVGEKKGFRDLNATLKAAQRALKLLETSEEARDSVGFFDQFKPTEGPKFLEQMGLKLTKDGRDLVADINDIQSLTLLERSGAAVTVPEFQRARPFLPERGDGAETLKGKLKRLIGIYTESINTMVEQYSPDQGYRGMVVDLPGEDVLSVEDIKSKYGVE